MILISQIWSEPARLDTSPVPTCSTVSLSTRRDAMAMATATLAAARVPGVTRALPRVRLASARRALTSSRARRADICVPARATRVRDEAAVSTDDAFAVDDRVGAIFPYVAASGTFMALWVFGPFPGSAYTGIADHDRWLTGLYEWAHFPSVFGVTSLITKYSEVGRWPALLHAVPGALWCALAPLQLHPKSREMFGGALHRASGRLMLAAAATLMVGYGVIDHNHLFADAHDFEGRAGTVSEAIDAAARSKLGDRVPPFNLTGVRGIAAWFIASGAQTARRGARRISRRIDGGQRDVGAGLWVAAQRPVYSAIRVGAVGLGFIGAVDDPSSSAAFADAFTSAPHITTLAYFAAVRVAARRMARGRRANETRPKGDERTVVGLPRTRARVSCIRVDYE